jgi:survival-of-motor-neuron-related-splicing factor 30
MPEVGAPNFLCVEDLCTNLFLVGFTGSGHEMRKDPSRARHIYQQGNQDE